MRPRRQPPSASSIQRDAGDAGALPCLSQMPALTVAWWSSCNCLSEGDGPLHELSARLELVDLEGSQDAAARHGASAPPRPIQHSVSDEQCLPLRYASFLPCARQV